VVSTLPPSALSSGQSPASASTAAFALLALLVLPLLLAELVLAAGVVGAVGFTEVGKVVGVIGGRLLGILMVGLAEQMKLSGLAVRANAAYPARASKIARRVTHHRAAAMQVKREVTRSFKKPLPGFFQTLSIFLTKGLACLEKPDQYA